MNEHGYAACPSMKQPRAHPAVATSDQNRRENAAQSVMRQKTHVCTTKNGWHIRSRAGLPRCRERVSTTVSKAARMLKLARRLFAGGYKKEYTCFLTISIIRVEECCPGKKLDRTNILLAAVVMLQPAHAHAVAQAACVRQRLAAPSENPFLRGASIVVVARSP